MKAASDIKKIGIEFTENQTKKWSKEFNDLSDDINDTIVKAAKTGYTNCIIKFPEDKKDNNLKIGFYSMKLKDLGYNVHCRIVGFNTNCLEISW